MSSEAAAMIGRNYNRGCVREQRKVVGGFDRLAPRGLAQDEQSGD